MDYTYKIEGSMSGGPQIVAQYEAIKRAVDAVTASLNKMKGASGGPKVPGASGGPVSPQQHQNIVKQQGAINKLAEGYHKFYSAARESGYIVREQISALNEYVEAAKDLSKAEMRFVGLNLSAEQTAAGLKAVRDVTREIGGVKLDAMTDQLTDLHAVFGDLKEAIEFLPTAAKTQYVFGALFGQTTKESEREVRDMMKALEHKQALRATGPRGENGLPSYTDKDIARFHEFYDVMVKAKVLTGGRLGGPEWLQFMGTGGNAAKMLSAEGMQNLLFMIQEFKPGRAGTSLQGMFTSFAALRQGAGGQRAVEAMMKLGLVDMKEFGKQGLKFSKEGRIKGRPMPGLVPIAAQLSENPLEFASSLMGALEKHGKNLFPRGIGGKEFDPKSTQHIALALSQIAGRQTVTSGLSSMIIQMPQYLKDAKATRNAMGLDQLTAKANESPAGQLLKFEAAYKNFQMTAGIPMLKLLADIAKTAGPAFSWLAAHPEWTKFAGGAILVTRSLTMLGGVLSTVGRQAFTFFKTMGSQNMPALAGSTSRWTQAGSRMGGALAGAAKLAIIGFAIEKTIGGLMDRAEGEIEKRKAGFEIADLEAKRAKLWDQLAHFKGTKTTPDEIADLDRQIGALKGTKAGSLRSGEFFGGKDFAVALAQLTHGPIGALLKWRTGWYGAGRSLVDAEANMFGGRQRSREEFKKTQIPEFGNALEMKAWMEAIRISGQFQAEEIAILGQLTGEKYPNYMTELDRQTSKLIESAAAISDFTQMVRDWKPPGWIPPDSKPPEPPGHATGGLTRRTHIARVHKDELIMPLSQVKGLPGSGAPPHVTVNSHVHVNGGDPAQVQKAVVRGIIEGKHELERTLNVMWKDRHPGT